MPPCQLLVTFLSNKTSSSLGALAAVLLAQLEHFRAPMMAAALPRLVGLVCNPANSISRSLAATAILQLAESVGSRMHIARMALQELALVLEDAFIAHHPCSILQARDVAAAFMCVMGHQPDASLRRMVAHAALESLVSILRDPLWPGQEGQAHAAWALQHLAKEAALQRIVAAAALPALVTSMSVASSPKVRLAAAEAIAALAATKDAQLRCTIYLQARAVLCCGVNNKADPQIRKAAVKALRETSSAQVLWLDVTLQ